MSAEETGKATAPKRTKPSAAQVKLRRRRAREFAVQGLYSWIVSQADAGAVDAFVRGQEGFEDIDLALYTTLLHGAIHAADDLRPILETVIDRPLRLLSPVEHGILLLAMHEFVSHPETPYRVVIDEAIELAKEFGGTDGHKYINGVLDRLAPQLRPHDPRPEGRSA